MPLPPEPPVPATPPQPKPRRPARGDEEMAKLHTAKDEVRQALRRRARLLKLLAVLSFLVTVALLGFGGYWVWSADTRSQAQSEEQSKALETQRQSAAAALAKVKDLATEFEAAKQTLAEKIIPGWPPRRVGGSLLGSSIAADGRTGWAVGEGGTILRTENAGASWQTQTSGTINILGSIQMAADGQRGWAVGDGGTILRTENAGASWRTQTSGTTNDLRSIQTAADGQRGWAVGQGGTILLLTTPTPDVSAIRSATDAASVGAALIALGARQDAYKPDVDQLKKLEDNRKIAEQEARNSAATVTFLERQFGSSSAPPAGGSFSDIFSPVFVRANINRAIVMLIMFFSVSVLLSVFRYALRLASQYDGRADALGLTVGDLDGRFHRLVNTMVPNGIDFGKMPKSPGEMAFDMAKDMVRTTGRRSP